MPSSGSKNFSVSCPALQREEFLMSFSTLQPFPSLESALAAIFGGGVTVARSRRISGGDINEAYGLTLTDGTTVFMKANTKKNAPLFAAEAAGLAAIACTGEIGTPQVLGCGVEGDKVFLLLSFVVGGKQASDYWETFAHQLAAMHRANTAEFTPGGVYGFCGDNFIGARPQANTAHESWISFSGTAGWNLSFGVRRAILTGETERRPGGCWTGWGIFWWNRNGRPCCTETCGREIFSPETTAGPGSSTRRPMWAMRRRISP